MNLALRGSPALAAIWSTPCENDLMFCCGKLHAGSSRFVVRSLRAAPSRRAAAAIQQAWAAGMAVPSPGQAADGPAEALVASLVAVVVAVGETVILLTSPQHRY